MKKSLIILLVVAVLVTCMVPFLGGCSDKNVLNVGNWAEYIGEGVIKDFEKYYEEVTGKSISVNYQTFETNETMLNKIANRANYDVVCPSDYGIEKLRANNMLVKLSTDLGKDVNGAQIEDYRDNVSDLVKNRAYDPTNEYSRAYTWGTMGILYNPALLKEADRVDADGNGHSDYIERMGWSAMWDTSYAKKVLMKDSVRDTFAIGAIYTFKEEILAGTMTVEEALNAQDPANINKIEANLKLQKEMLKGYEVDTGKQDAVDGNVTMTLQWGGDAVWAMSEAADLDTGVELKYYVPMEGSNIFFDGWCISKYSTNREAAQLFINFMCRPDVSLANMDYIGYSSPCNTQEFVDYMKETYPDEPGRSLEYFMGAGNTELINAPESMYPNKEVIDRCGVMKDFGSKDELIIQLWQNVKNYHVK